MISPFINRSRKGLLTLLAFACASSFTLAAANAQITTVFYILTENRNFTAGTDTTGGSVLVGNSAAPYINALISSTPTLSYANQVSWCSCYHHVLSTPSGANPSIHPSEPNYVWMEAGSNLSKLDDNDPYGSGASVLQISNFVAANPSLTGECLSGLLQNAGISWKSYQEGIDLLTTTGANSNLGTNTSNEPTNTVVAQNQWTVPLQSFSGTSPSYVNPYNGSHQYNFACKHNGSIFFTATNGSTVTTANFANSNVATFHYAPLEQLATDLANNTAAQYNIITPDQFNDMHTALSSGFTYTASAANHNFGTGVHYTGDLAQVAQGDNFLAIVVPEIMASPVYQAGHAAIVIWTDETEGTNQNDFTHTLLEVAISPLCKNANTAGAASYQSTVNFTHSSDVATIQKVFGVTANTPTGFLNDAANPSNSSGAQAGSAPGFGTSTAQDLSDLFQAGVVPANIPGLNLTASGFIYNRKTNVYTQTVTVTNALSTAITNPIYLVVGNLSSNTTLINKAGTTTNNFPGNPYVSVGSGLAAGASATVTLQFTPPSAGSISDTMSAINTAGTP